MQAAGAALSRCGSCLGVRGSWCGALSAHSRVAQRSDQRVLMIARRDWFVKNKMRTFAGYEARPGVRCRLRLNLKLSEPENTRKL